MTARAVDIHDHGAPNEFRDGHPAASATMPTRYRLDVFAASVEDVVRSAGGWLFDRAMGGWEVNLLVTEPCDTRRLRILGINTIALQPTFASTPDFPRAHAIAVAAD
ncbi:MAG: hypothetical protein JO280_06970, partial [Mycobacteriaceae bacterium]|nr:hypothetical protein [Mycobacteriaceae bacterium]